MGIDELLREKREEILRIAAKHGAYNVRVFGSVARGEARADSDVDFLVEIEAGRNLGCIPFLQKYVAIGKGRYRVPLR
jgi:predicted nucleotidyltransferase